jgi:hypothetical protein
VSPLCIFTQLLRRRSAHQQVLGADGVAKSNQPVSFKGGLIIQDSKRLIVTYLFGRSVVVIPLPELIESAVAVSWCRIFEGLM